MSNEQHRVGVNEAHLVVRHLRLEGLDASRIDPLTSEILETFGVDEVTFDVESSVLNVAYDAAHCSLDEVESVIRKHGADIGHGWWTRFKEGYYRFIDSNIKDNVKERPSSCHDQPGAQHHVRRGNKASRRV